MKIYRKLYRFSLSSEELIKGNVCPVIFNTANDEILDPVVGQCIFKKDIFTYLELHDRGFAKNYFHSEQDAIVAFESSEKEKLILQEKFRVAEERLPRSVSG